MSKQKIRDGGGRQTFRIKTAAAITGINAVLTLVKFVLYFFSGSMAIFAEAWHSFADIATSLLVFIALWSARRRSAKETAPERRSGHNYSELGISLGIGLMLAVIAGFLIFKFFTTETHPIENSLVSGLIFLFFAFVSYCVYRFETHIGEQVNSVGLVSDGLHSRADMIASLVTGFALILYTMGLNLDRWVSLLIALFVLSFAVETILTVVMVFFRGKDAPLHRYRVSRLFSILFDHHAFQEKSRVVQSFFAKRFGNQRIRRIAYKLSLALLLCIAIGIFLSSTCYQVGLQEAVVVERFGRPVDLSNPVGPGLHVKWPWPVDRVLKVDVARIRTMNIGNISSQKSTALLWTKSHGTEEPFLTGDNNFFYPYIVLHYRVKDVSAYLYRNADPEGLLNAAAHRIATLLFAHQTFYDIASTNRERLNREMFVNLQSALADLDTGIELVSVNFKDMHPPISVAGSFEKVIAGYQEKRETINDAMGYQYGTIPNARGQAAKETEAARGYIVDRVKKAEGEASRFVMSLPVTARQKEVSIMRIRLDAVREALQGKKTIVIDPKTGTSDIWMDFEGFFQRNVNAENKEGEAS